MSLTRTVSTPSTGADHWAAGAASRPPSPARPDGATDGGGDGLTDEDANGGWANVVSTKRNYAEITEKLGQTYEISINTYKPFACGIVIHPTLDACIQLRNENKLTADQIERVELHVNRLVESLTGKKTPKEVRPISKKRFNYLAKKAKEWQAGISR